MADWTATGYERSMKITVTKTGDNTPPTVTNIYLDGQAAFDTTPGVDDITFGRYTDEEFNARVIAYTSYLRSIYDDGGTSPEPGLVDSINWINATRPTATIQPIIDSGSISVMRTDDQLAYVFFTISGTSADTYGVCWNDNGLASPTPTIDNNIDIKYGGIGSVSAQVSGLVAGICYARCFATNHIGTTYSSIIEIPAFV